MSKRKGLVPSYRLHRPSGQARIIVDREHIYLGKYGSPESREKYAKIIADLATRTDDERHRFEDRGALLPLSINELILAYWRFAKTYYVKDDEPTKELACMRDALRPLRQVYGHTDVREFGPKSLKKVRQHMIEGGLARGVINLRVSRIKRVFKWAVAEELVPPSVYHGLQAVDGLRFGRTKARETEPVRPVPDLYVAAVLPFLSPHVATMVKVQRMTGMRSCELVIMRPCDIDMSADVWIYEPYDHKNRWRGHRKLIPLGPEVQRLLEPFLNRDPEVFLFSPREAEQWRLENRPPYDGQSRKTPVFASELRRREKLKQARRRRKSKRPKRDRYDTTSYRRAISYGLQKATKAGFALPHWHPHRLRHNRGTEVRQQYGIEAAQVALGHARADITEVYAEKNLDHAKRIAKEMG